jgi:integrase
LRGSGVGVGAAERDTARTLADPRRAARLLWAAYRYREVQKGQPTDRRSRRHIARFILVGLYTGTRASAICGAALTSSVGRGWVDLDAGVFYRRAAGAIETKKRQPTIPIPPRLLAHMRRWKRLGLSTKAVVEWNGESVKKINKAFRGVRADAGLGPDVVPHVLRHYLPYRIISGSFKGPAEFIVNIGST